MYIFDLGKLPGQQSMLIFHALARMGIEALVIVSPKIPLVSIGYFQDAEREVDLKHCRESKIPFMRREVGGGATYLDENQIFYQLIWKKDNPKFPRAIDEIYPWFSQSPVETYRTFGIEAEFRVVNDIITSTGKKIAGEGGGNIGDCMVFVGGILLDFNYEAMSRILKVPDEKFRDKVYKTMEENLTTMKRELGTLPRREEVITVLKEKFENKVGRLEAASLNPQIIEKMKQLESWMTSEEFLLKKTPRIPAGVKIREGVEVLFGLHKARGGLIRTAEEISESRIEDITISGDFTFYPKEGLAGLEESLEKTPLKEEEIIERVETYYEKKKVESPGVESRDISTTILNPVQGAKKD
ncbi:MAG TPA: lipoate--protein ligase family protein [Thermodesulfobacteriota bacterium]|nr:lipoate--protein ligase family protein [Thermodesulfobacteriota bacterium]